MRGHLGGGSWTRARVPPTRRIIFVRDEEKTRTFVASAAMAQAVGSIFCQACYITNVATCVIGVKECNAVERFSSCVCAYTGNKPQLRQCLIALIRDPDFQGTLLALDFKTLLDADKPTEAEDRQDL
ncbi:hypothetical protein BGZ82_006198 [Podila clonocystis]|nr:hypothetical protein BGZ82_006198 [Podila clonocystis]